jgi:hypothetical protein
MQRDWNLLATSSHYNTAVAVHEELCAGNIENAGGFPGRWSLQA